MNDAGEKDLCPIFLRKRQNLQSKGRQPTFNIHGSIDIRVVRTDLKLETLHFRRVEAAFCPPRACMQQPGCKLAVTTPVSPH